MTGCAASGKLADEKKTPDSTHWGSIATFISPEAASMVRARETTSSASAANDSDATRAIAPSCTIEPRTGTSKASIANPSTTAISSTRKTSRESTKESRYSRRDIGVATRRFSRCLRRASTIEKPIPHMPPPMMFMPSRPGMRKSM